MVWHVHVDLDRPLSSDERRALLADLHALARRSADPAHPWARWSAGYSLVTGDTPGGRDDDEQWLRVAAPAREQALTFVGPLLLTGEEPRPTKPWRLGTPRF